jgi:hypothetical protein
MFNLTPLDIFALIAFTITTPIFIWFLVNHYRNKDKHKHG